MKLQITTDYAIRMIGYLAQHRDQLVVAKVASRQLGITYPYFRNVAIQLRAAGYIESVRGPAGGYRLAKDPAHITLYDIIRVMEGDLCLNQCLKNTSRCRQYADDTQQCPVYPILQSAQQEMIHILASKRINEIWSTPSNLNHLAEQP